jgi:DNA-binding CsgD family transcriptional regulator
VPRGRTRPPRPSIPTLSAREREALEAVTEGLSAEEAAARLVISPHTLRSHLRNAVLKLEARSTTHAVARAIKAGLIDPSA